MYSSSTSDGLNYSFIDNSSEHYTIDDSLSYNPTVIGYKLIRNFVPICEQQRNPVPSTLQSFY
jgi:hypothetical protein